MAFQPSSIFPKSNSNHIRSSFQQFYGPASMQRLQSFHGPLPKHQPSLSKLLLSVDESTVASSSSQFFQNSDVWVFLAGVFPFAWATVEFWRRIMFGEPFGTGRDSVIIGMDDAPQDSRGRRVLGKGALITAYVLFVIAFGTIGVVLYSVLSSAPPPTEFV
ncbi:hypothetical protein IV203_019279 [Nitzschia inconspicua]|uniref:Uncharacterized protein n=1 Tax=Nitzschia inconspicua TaxID=303405 RepID=A0A9K3Q712_9STRA|nr:hypothetical protein IV203_019279 [Nitzschia inconspicua]